MAFTLSAIQQAHQQFTGVNLKLFKAFKDMGMTYNIVNVKMVQQHSCINQKMISLRHL